MTIDFIYPYGSTPLTIDETQGLIPKFITTQLELNEYEQRNIIEAELSIFSRKVSNILSVKYIQKLHKKMFGNTWKWAGEFRRTNKNIGIDWPMIPFELKYFIDDVIYLLSSKTYSYIELAARFHHRLVYIHCFTNGNGRHARLATDLLMVSLKQKRLSWGKNIYKPIIDIRKIYIDSLREADNHDYGKLTEFLNL